MKLVILSTLLLLTLVTASWNPFEDWGQGNGNNAGKCSETLNISPTLFPKFQFPNEIYDFDADSVGTTQIDNSGHQPSNPGFGGMGDIGKMMNAGGNNMDPMTALSGMVGNTGSDNQFLGMASQLYQMYKINPEFIGGQLQSIIKNYAGSLMPGSS